MMKWKHILFVLSVVLFAITSQAQVTFIAKASSKKLGLNERVRVDFVMNADGDDFNPPNFDGFRVVGGPNQSISNSYINRKRTYSKTYSYFLSPLKQGNARVGEASIRVSGQTYKTNPITLQVTAAVKTPSNGEGINPEIVAEDNVHLVAEVSNATPYLNERITIVYKLYVSNNVSITSQWREINSPRYADFWSKNIDSQKLNVFEEKYKGEDYRYVVLKTTVLYPQKTGNLDIEPLTLDVPIDVPGKKRNIFGRTRSTRVNKTISAGGRSITVKPLPIVGKPDTFTGAVGDFKFNLQTNKNTLDTNQAFELKATVSGSGNLNTLTLPSLKAPSTLEVYAPERTENLRTRASGISGSISETYIVIPQYKGSYPIRPITFSYFNPATERYQSIASSDIIITVANGSAANTGEQDSGTETQLQELVIPEARFRYLKLKADLIAIKKAPFFKSSLFWSLLAGPLLCIPFFILIGKKRNAMRADVHGNKLRKANKMARKYLAEAKKNRHDKVIFYEALERSLHNYLKARLALETAEMSKEHISAVLLGRKAQAASVLDFERLLKRCEFARYSPTGEVTIKQDYEKAIAIISMIDKQIQ
ncbi:MAG: hypothetical protein ACJAYD_000938 [Patiriisocius sp.]|jgi:hypothetical protein